MLRFALVYVFTNLLISSTADNDKWAFVRQRLELSSRAVSLQENTQWVPNTAKIGCGYDLAQGSPVCYTGDCQMNGFRRPIFTLDYSKRATGSCDNRLIPQNIYIDCIPAVDSTASTEIISTLQQLYESTTKGIDVKTSVSGGFAGYSASFSYGYSKETRSMIDTIVKESSTVFFTTLKTSWMRLSLFEPKMNLSDDFRFVIDKMPCCEFNVSVEEYVRKYIIGYFGYAYVDVLLLGGIAQQRIIITQSDQINLQRSGSTVSHEAGIAVAALQIFSASINVKATETYDQQTLNTLTRYSKQERITTLGGDISLQTLQDWSKTVSKNPAVVKFGVSLIFDLLTSARFPYDSNIDAKAQLIRSVVEKYLINPLSCYNGCTDESHGTCVDSGYFQFGICKCHNGWTGLDCSQEVDDQVRAQTEMNGICTLEGNSHLVGFPVAPQQAGLRSSYWCPTTGRILVVKNAFIEFYANITNKAYGVEYYEITFLYQGLRLCTITPQNDNCSNRYVEMKRFYTSPNSRQIFYYLADKMEINIYSQWIDNHLIYNIEVIQSYYIIRTSSGLCVTRIRQCRIESSIVRKRSTSEATAYEVCGMFISEASKIAKQITGDTKNQLIIPAREACVTDVLSSSNEKWGECAMWLVLVDSIRQTPLNNSRRKELIAQLPSTITEAVRRIEPRARVIING